ncbi:MAG TPA: ATP-grasp domain-containing protein [Methylotenera sp.]|nr:ATP-grasp domain-containing protein [Methylotenera sp.]
MKILLLEYITAGGLNHVPLPASLLREGTLMRDALLRDFSQLAEVEIITTCDTRVDLSELSQQAIVLDHKSNPMPVWQSLLQSCDAALIVAPETAGVLTELTQLIEASPAKNLGCSSQAVELTSSKFASYQALKNANILTIPTYIANEVMLSNLSLKGFFQHGYIIKPNDGAGCEDTLYFADIEALQIWLDLNPEMLTGYIVQPYQTGTPASISMLCKDGKAWVLGCNQQKIAMTTIDANQQSIHYNGSVINGLSLLHRTTFERLADSIAHALPGLNGYVGVDVIVDGEAVYVVEINPRITTSYIGLRESLGCNPAQLIWGSADNPSVEWATNLTTKVVDINLNNKNE